MPLTLLRQKWDVRQSDAFIDSLAPSVANYETNPTSLEDDLTSVRSQLQNLLNRNGASFPVGNWWDDVSAPGTFEGGSKRGVNELNQQLHDLERKRVLRDVCNLTDVVVPASVQATGTFSSSGAFSNGETVTIGGQTYTFTTPFVNAANNIDASVSTAQTHENLRRAINGQGVAGTNYGTGTPTNTSVTATDTASSNVLTAILGGTQGNLVATTEACANASFGAGTLTGGAGDRSILTLGQLPSNTTAAVGLVTTRGTVVAAHTGTFGNVSLDEVSGGDAIAPRNLLTIVDGSTRDPILSSNRVVYGLLQTETATDGHTMTGTTPVRAQISFVRVNSTGDDLEFCPAVDIAGKMVNYCSRERVAMEDLNEYDFLRGAVVDVPATSTTTRQTGYDNQGATPVDLLTNATLDLEGPGLYWRIRDDLEAMLFQVTEGSAGGTSEVWIGQDTDTFNNDAVNNDFRTGASFDTAGTPIQVAETAGIIERAGDLTMRASGSGELIFDDSYRAGSTWSLSGIRLADTSPEWSAFESAFGEVSLLNAIVQAYSNGNPPVRLFHVASATVTADNDLGGPGTGASNLDVDWPDAFVTLGILNTHVYLNGRLMRPGTNSAANHDYYPGSSYIAGNVALRFERTVVNGDQLVSMVY